MNCTKIIILSSLFLFLVPLEMRGQKTEADVKQLLQQRDREVKELIGPEGTTYTPEQRSELKDMINGIIDFGDMAAYALQETYDTLSAEQRDEFVDLFSTVVRDQSLGKLDIYRAEVAYEKITVEGDEAEVKTIARLENVRTPVNYTLEFKNGEWVITDLTIDDVSTAESYKRQFQNIIRKRGYDALLNSLRKRAARA